MLTLDDLILSPLSERLLETENGLFVWWSVLTSQTYLAMSLSQHLSNFTHLRQQGFIRH